MLRKFTENPGMSSRAIGVAWLFLTASILTFLGTIRGFAQEVTGYTLTKLGPSEFVASNPTSAGQNFFLLLTPNGSQVQSATKDGAAALSIQGSNGTSLIGPFSVPADASITLQVFEKGQVTGSETFALLTESQLRASASSLTPKIALSLSNGSAEPLRSAVAAPNVSRNNQPIDFLVNLNAPADIVLSLFTLAGEKVYGAQTQGSAGANKLVWNLSGNANGRVTSGLYLYYLEVAGSDGSRQTRVGKIVVLQ